MNAARRWRGKYCFASRDEQIPKTITFLISPKFSLVAKCNARFIKQTWPVYRRLPIFSWGRGDVCTQSKQISQSDIRCCRCRNFSFKQASGLKGGIRTNRTLSLDPPLHTPGGLGFFHCFVPDAQSCSNLANFDRLQ